MPEPRRSSLLAFWRNAMLPGDAAWRRRLSFLTTGCHIFIYARRMADAAGLDYDMSTDVTFATLAIRVLASISAYHFESQHARLLRQRCHAAPQSCALTRQHH